VSRRRDDSFGVSSLLDGIVLICLPSLPIDRTESSPRMTMAFLSTAAAGLLTAVCLFLKKARYQLVFAVKASGIG